MKSAVDFLRKDPKEKKVNVHVYLTKVLKTELDKICRQNKMSTTELMEKGLRFFVANYLKEKKAA